MWAQNPNRERMNIEQAVKNWLQFYTIHQYVLRLKFWRILKWDNINVVHMHVIKNRCWLPHRLYNKIGNHWKLENIAWANILSAPLLKVIFHMTVNISFWNAITISIKHSKRFWHIFKIYVLLGEIPSDV